MLCNRRQRWHLQRRQGPDLVKVFDAGPVSKLLLFLDGACGPTMDLQ